MAGDAVAEEGPGAGAPGAIEDLLWNHHVAGVNLLLHDAHGTYREKVGCPQLFHGEDVGPIIHL